MNYEYIIKLLLNIGQMIAVLIVNGGPGPQCFSKAVVDYLCSGMIKATIVDVPDAEIQQQLRLVCEILHFHWCC